MTRRMLIVEDERDICECLQEFFQARGFVVACAFSGEEALDRLSNEAVDVLLLDILLPGVSGIEVLRRAKELHPAVRAVMVTGLAREEFAHEARQFGASGFVTKPFDFSEDTWSSVLAEAA